MKAGELREELDNYGDHLDVVLESATSERHYDLAEVATRQTPDGVVVVIVVGEYRHTLDDE